jgi:exodeoxyribonuclease VII small subunit
MSKAAKNSGPANPAAMTYEEALTRLETIVQAMESEELPLESMLARFEEGMNLSKACQAKLAEAELKIKQLEQTEDGTLAVKPASLPELVSEA